MSKKKKKKKANAVTAKNLPIQTNKKPKKKKEKQIPEELKVDEIKTSEETITQEEQEVIAETDNEVEEENEPVFEEPTEESEEKEPVQEEMTPFEIREVPEEEEPAYDTTPEVEPFIPVEPTEPIEDEPIYETVPVTPIAPVAASQTAPSANGPARVPNNIDLMLEKNRIEQEKIEKNNKRKNIFRNILIFIMVVLIVFLIGFLIFMITKNGRNLIHVEPTTTTTTTALKTRLVSYKTSSTTSRGIVTIATTTKTAKPDYTEYRIKPVTNNPERSSGVEYEHYTKSTTTTKAQAKYTYEATYDDATTLYKVRIYKNGELIKSAHNLPILVKSSGTEIASTKTSTASIPYAIAGKLKSCGSLTVFDPEDGKDHTMTASKCTPQ